MTNSVPIYALCESGPLDQTPATTVAPGYYKVLLFITKIIMMQYCYCYG